MNNDSVFRYSYSPKQNDEVQTIRDKYLPQPESKLDELKALDRKVQKPANVFAYVFGSLSAIIMGAGMSLVMTDIGTQLGLPETMIPGIVIGIAGLALAIINYPIHKGILASRKKKYAEQILALSEQLMSA